MIRFHLGSPRKIHPGQKIHSSLFLADPDTIYTPKARPLGNDYSFWDDFRNGKQNQWLERDLYDYTEDVIKNFSRDPDNTMQILRHDRDVK